MEDVDALSHWLVHLGVERRRDRVVVVESNTRFTLGESG